MRAQCAVALEMRGMVANFGGFLSDAQTFCSKSSRHRQNQRFHGACRRCVPAEIARGFVVRTPEGAVYPLCEYLWQEPEAYFRQYCTGRLAAGRDAGGDCGTGPQSSRWSALAERGRPAAADKKCTVRGWSAGGDIPDKFRCVPHLTGRRFERGVTDCYTLFRDALPSGRELICRILSVRMTGGATVRNALPGQYGGHRLLPGLPLSSAQARAISCCAALAHRWPIMPPFTAATVSCFTICLHN